MQARNPLAPGVLVLGDPATAQERAQELRACGYTAWVATTEAELRWLRDQAWIRPAYAVVDLASQSIAGQSRMRLLASLAMRTGLPVVLVGVHDVDAALFNMIIASLPGDVTTQTIADALAQASTAP